MWNIVRTLESYFRVSIIWQSSRLTPNLRDEEAPRLVFRKLIFWYSFFPLEPFFAQTGSQVLRVAHDVVHARNARRTMLGDSTALARMRAEILGHSGTRKETKDPKKTTRGSREREREGGVNETGFCVAKRHEAFLPASFVFFPDRFLVFSTCFPSCPSGRSFLKRCISSLDMGQRKRAYSL